MGNSEHNSKNHKYFIDDELILYGLNIGCGYVCET
jgi:hypothetical protein